MERAELKIVLLQALQDAAPTSHGDLTEATTLQTGLGLDSLGLVGVLIDVQDRLDVAIQLEEVRDVATVGDMLNLLQRKLDGNSARNAAA
jgi:acyl carrier protein